MYMYLMFIIRKSKWRSFCSLLFFRWYESS